MNIEKHISALLFEHDCVIIPDFGGFVCNYSSAGVNPAKHQFSPPFKKISFNRNLKNNDGLLANQVSVAEGISYSDSNRAIAEFVQHLNHELAVSGRVELENIGAFYPGEEHTLLFEQDDTVNYLPDSFGLSSFSSPAIKREPIERKIGKQLKDKVVIPSKEKTTGVPRRGKALRYILPVAAVLVISFLLWLPFQMGMLKNMDYSSLNPFAPKPEPRYKASETTLPDADVNKENISGLLALASAPDTARYLNIVIGGQLPIVVQLKDDAAPVTKPKHKTKAGNKHFQIVGGAFAVPENAEKFLRKLVSMGYDASILDIKGKALRFVSYGGFSTREEALHAMDKIRAVQGDVWLMNN